MARVKKFPQRMCVACRQMKAKREMVRVVRTPSGDVRVDPTGKAAGRGAYVDLAAECVETALRERRLEHALEAPVPPAVGEELREMLTRPRTPPKPKVIRIPAGETVRGRH
jgi:predicted RNA-binding protein YlxR (DUF448 family)